MAQIVLFICTGNYYRSRFAEIFFNALAEEAGIDWSADSRGLKHDISGNVGPISSYTVAALAERNIFLTDAIRFPLPLLVEDLQEASQIIALNEDEHRTPLEARFPEWADRVDYWHVPDEDRMTISEALAAIELQVRALLEGLASPEASNAARKEGTS